MQRIHLLLTSSDQPAETFGPLIRAVTADGGRVGLLAWHPGTASSDPHLAQVAASGLFRSVQVDGAGSVVHKPRKGPAVLRDVVREQFRGCRAVIVMGEATCEPTDEASNELEELIRIVAKGDAFLIESGNETREFGAAELASRLRGPRPLGNPT